MTVTLKVQAALTGRESLASSPALGTDKTVVYSAFNVTSPTLTGTTTPAVDTTPVDLSFTLTAADKDWDLTSVPSARDPSQNLDLTGKKLVGVLIKADKDNSGSFVVQGQGGNAYNLFGASTDRITVHPGEVILKSFVDDATLLAAVAAGAKDIRFSGTVGDKWNAILFFGP